VLTIVFSAQTLAQGVSSPTLLASSFGLLGLPLGGVFSRGKRRRGKWKVAHFVLLFGALLLSTVGCGGYGGSQLMQPNPPQAQSAQASAALTLTVQ